MEPPPTHDDDAVVRADDADDAVVHRPNFRMRTTLEKRRRERQRVTSLHPNHVPVVVTPADDRVPTLDKDKLLIHFDITASQFAYVVKRRLPDGLRSTESLFLFCDDKTMVCGNDTMKDVYERHRCRDDGFLYVTYARENTFGGESERGPDERGFHC